MAESDKAVFLSYASEDAEAAARICAGLRSAGIEVWFDQSELRGGDSWDHNIRKQIRECALFVPIISAHTQSRPEGYFRLEWDLADQRSHMIVRSKAFIVPVCVDRTPDKGAEVPESFSKAQWTRLPDGATTPAFCERVAMLLSGTEPKGRSAQLAPAHTAPPAHRRLHWGMVILLIALGLPTVSIIGWVVSRSVSPPAIPKVPAAAGAPAATGTEKSIAVLPFVDMSEKRDQEYFSDGLSEELIDHLSRNPDLKVIARTSSFAFKGKNEDIRTIAQTLGVANLLEGSVRKAGSDLKITAELIRAADGVHLWSDSYERHLTDVFKVQEEIAAAVVKGLQAKLLPPVVDTHSSTKNVDAYGLYLRGQYFVRRANDADVEQGIAILKQAIALEPDYAPAHLELATAYLYIWTFGRADLKSIASAHEELNIALRLDPQLPAARFLRANMAIVDWDWAAAKSQLEQMRAAGMHDAGVLIRSGQLARAFGQSEQAVDYFIQGLKLDPLAVIYHVQLAMAYQALGRAAECRAAAETALSISPTTVKAHLMIGLTELDAGHLDAARAQMEQENGEYYRLEGLSMVAFAQKRKEESDAALAKLISSYQDNAGVQIAQVYAYRAERDKAFEWLERSIAQKDPGMVNLKTDPLLANLRSDPRFKALLRKMNLPV